MRYEGREREGGGGGGNKNKERGIEGESGDERGGEKGGERGGEGGGESREEMGRYALPTQYIQVQLRNQRALHCWRFVIVIIL